MCDGQGRHTLQVATCGQAGELVIGKHERGWPGKAHSPGSNMWPGRRIGDRETCVMAREEEGRHTLQVATCGQAGELVIGKHV